MKRVLLTNLAAATMGVFLATGAHAADLFVPPVEPTPVPAFSWTGFYVGVSGGWGFNKGDVDYDCGQLGPVCDGTFPGNASLDVDGPIVGGTLGVNWQVNSFVLGLEGDMSWTDWHDSETVEFQPGDTASAELDFDWFATVRARVGFVADRFLIYGTGGAAFADVELSTTGFGGPGPEDFRGSSDGVKVGWTAGGGVEYGATEHILVKAEALYYDLGDVSVTATDPVNFPGFSYDAKAELTGVIVRGGVNWLF